MNIGAKSLILIQRLGLSLSTLTIASVTKRLALTRTHEVVSCCLFITDITVNRSRAGTTTFNNYSSKRKERNKRSTMSQSLDPEDHTGVKQFNNRFLDCAARGDEEELASLIGSVDINIKSDRGWTALMFAARNGHKSIISKLIEKGCDVNALNASGQTALDIAQFWNHSECSSVLALQKQEMSFEQLNNYFSLNPLYRASDLRKDVDTLKKYRESESTKYIVFANRCPFLRMEGTPVSKYRFVTFSVSQLPEQLVEQAKVVFLGLETWDPDSSGWFAVDFEDADVSFAEKIHPDAEFIKTPYPSTLQMEPNQAGIFAEAHSILCWLNRYRFCPTCGSKTKIVDGGYKQVCSNADCSSHKGVHNTCYPRVDPSLIMLVVSPDKKKCLLGRSKRHPPKMYSCLAGFMEPGECIEDTCRREVEEESGVKVGRVEYHSSQPWPFPATLMLGCTAYARTDDVKVDKDELEDARWFSRAEAAQMLARQHSDGLFIPPPAAIAHHLIKSWVMSSPANL